MRELENGGENYIHNELKGLLKIVGSSGSGTTAVGRSDSQDSRVSYEDPSWGGGNVFYTHSEIEGSEIEGSVLKKWT